MTAQKTAEEKAKIEAEKAAEEKAKVEAEEKAKVDAEAKAKDESNKPKGKVIPTLYFHEGFWCPELNESFAIGYYRPKNEKELKALKKYGAKETTHTMSKGME